MIELSRKEKIKLLKIKSKKKSIINDFAQKNIDLSLESFWEVDYSINLMEKLFIKIDREINDKEEFTFQHNKAVVIEQLTKIKSMLFPVLMESEVLLYHLHYRETGVVCITLKDALQYVEWIVDFTGYPKGHLDFVIIEPNLSFGICVERWGYRDTFISWGLFKQLGN
ncbi:hypothetical protein [Rossellomorea aquimaris]|uniref:Uncharacterized protein n=1 Tax=Rossellomorea aquimaris TaxID=189382 RepID=A0A5D4U6X5_9BACI|nr:hypothetical protein [Rossellomorea aquimaris]TYS76506.1 hypothetical protein FZD05_17955 [Rossellomorea aquimaris]TYS83096.1 hypothetical protein FZC85_18550 [Rossellomorea aquimaris]